MKLLLLIMVCLMNITLSGMQTVQQSVHQGTHQNLPMNSNIADEIGANPLVLRCPFRPPSQEFCGCMGIVVGLLIVITIIIYFIVIDQQQKEYA